MLILSNKFLYRSDEYMKSLLLLSIYSFPAKPAITILLIL